MYEVSAAINDVETIKVRLTADFQLDTEAILAAVQPNTKLIWVCSPNNPSGNLVQTEAIETLLNTFEGLVVAVSYTHLDVYKRQRQAGAEGILVIPIEKMIL